MKKKHFIRAVDVIPDLFCLESYEVGYQTIRFIFFVCLQTRLHLFCSM